MHGIIFNELKKFVDNQVGGDAWLRILDGAGFKSKVYMPIEEYPDAEAVALVGAASRHTGIGAQDLLEGFGRFIAPDLVQLYRHLLKPDWRTLELIENTEQTIHAAVRLRNPGARPPELKCERLSPDEVVIVYSSQRQMCAVAVGIARGLAEWFKEQVEVDQRSCMHRGDPACRIHVRRAG